jgi:hypothetical protein
MSHYEVDYKKVDNAEEQAVEDIKRWFGEKKFSELEPLVIEEVKNGCTVEQLAFSLMLGGVQGYPVVAWYNTIKRKLDSENSLPDES